MKLLSNPPKNSWERIVQRPSTSREVALSVVPSILAEVKNKGDQALIKYTSEFDKISLDRILVTQDEIDSAGDNVTEELKNSIRFAIENVKAFHKSQISGSLRPVETNPGVVCWIESIPIESVGLYIPGGGAPLFSTVYMLGVPAMLAGSANVCLCTPPQANREINPLILYTAKEVGISKIYKVGGAQAIAAMAYGTESVQKVDKIFGPGNQFVATAKELVSRNGVDIDFTAGPSEVLVIADKMSNPEWIAADLIAQAEHGEDSQVVLVSDSQNIIDKCLKEIEKQTATLKRENIILKSLEKSIAVCFTNLEECIDFSNFYAPEHLILSVEDPKKLVSSIKNAGSVFLGSFTPEVAGDYVSGTNHCLPTGGTAKIRGGVKVSDFKKEITFQEISREGLAILNPHIQNLANAEGLSAHANASQIRFKNTERR